MTGCRSYSALLLGLLTACSGSPAAVDGSDSETGDSKTKDDDQDDDDKTAGSETGDDELNDTSTSTSTGTSTTGTTSTTSTSTGDVGSTSTSGDSTSSTTGVTETCQEGTAVCLTANRLERCESGSLVEEDCPNGTNCEDGTCNPVSCANNLPGYEGSGGVTVYWFAQGTLTQQGNPDQDVHCSFGSDRNWNNDDGGAGDRVFNISNEQLFGAIATEDYRGSAACGSCVELRYNGNNVRITVADECPLSGGNPTCTAGHIDLSRQAFQMLTGQSTGDHNGVSWNVVPCGLTEPIAIKLKEPDNAFYKAFTVMKHEYPIAGAQYQRKDGTWIDAVRDPANFFYSEEPNGDFTGWVRIIDVNGGIIEQELQHGVEGPQMGTHQFACQ